MSDNSWDTFGGLDEAPVITEQRGRQFVLNASDLGSLDIGSPIYYRRLQVGQVIAFDLAPDGKSVEIKIFVNAPYDKYVYPGTRFWNASGIDVSLGADGLNVRTESLVALLVGGVAFDARPSSARPSPPRTPIRPSRSTATASPRSGATDPYARRYVLHFNESLRGLVGRRAGDLSRPARRRGLERRSRLRRRIGNHSPARGDHVLARAPARVRERAGGGRRRSRRRCRTSKSARAVLRRLVEERGLRAQLKSGNLLTGQLYVAFDYYPGRGEGQARPAPGRRSSCRSCRAPSPCSKRS